jgi:hypothetical protein
MSASLNIKKTLVRYPLSVLLSLCLSAYQICNAQLSTRIIRNKLFHFSQYEVRLSDSVKLTELTKAIQDDIPHAEDNRRYFYNDLTVVYDSVIHEVILKDSFIYKVRNTHFIDINKDGKLDIIHCGFDIEADKGCTYIFLNTGEGHYERIFHQIALPNQIEFDNRVAFAGMTLYEGFCCEDIFEFIDEYAIDFNKNLVFREIEKYYLPEALLDRENISMNNLSTIQSDSAKLYTYFSIPTAVLLDKQKSKDSSLIPVRYEPLSKDEPVSVLGCDHLYGKNYLFVLVNYHSYFNLHSFYKPSRVFGLIEEKYVK